MRTIKGPGLFLAQFATDTPPHNTLAGIAKWAKGYGYKAIQIPTRDRRFLDLDKAAESQTYCDEIKGQLAEIGLETSAPGSIRSSAPIAATIAFSSEANTTPSPRGRK